MNFKWKRCVSEIFEKKTYGNANLDLKILVLSAATVSLSVHCNVNTSPFNVLIVMSILFYVKFVR